MKLVKKFIAIFAIIAIINVFPIIVTLFNNNSDAASPVTLSLAPQPYIDVVLSKSRTNTNLTNFEANLRTALTAQGVDISKVKISAIEAQTVNMQSAFQWNRDVNSGIGNITIENGGQNVTMVGNQTTPGKNAIWIIPPEDVEQTFNFGYDLNFGDSFNAAGMLLRVKQTGNTLTGYMLSFNKPDKDWNTIAGNGAIWSFTYVIGDNYTNMSKVLKKSLAINSSGTLTVKATRTEIEVSGGGLSGTQTYVLDNEYGTGFGFFTDHYSHNCERIGSFALTNINLRTEAVKNIEEVLRQPDWRENSIKVLVNVEDVVNKQLSNPNSLGELLTRMINDEIYFCAWGQTATQSQCNNFIASNNGNGIFINNTNYNSSITQTAQYIKTLINQRSSSNYVILDENTILTSSDSNIMKNTADRDWPYGKWKVVHDCEYFENNIGQFAQSGQYISDMITSFDKTGKYEIYYQDMNIVPNIIYVHRRPVAEIQVTRSGNNVTLTSLGYDLDNYSNNRGVKTEEWKWRQVGSSTWNNGKLTSIASGTDFLVQLRVQDFQGAWSQPVSKYITKTDILPIASFKVKNTRTSIYENVEVVDGSYDPYGGTITNWEWKVYKVGNNNAIWSGTGRTPLQNYRSYGTGDYKMTLIVTNNRNKKSEEFSRTFTIIPDNEAPEVTVKPTECEWTKSVTVNLTFKDRLR